MARRKSIASSIRNTLRTLGPGLVTGASDDDPSGIATYSQAGARFGTSLLWTALATYPLMVNIQEMCARIGLVTNHGLMGVIKRYYSKKVLYLILIICFPSITLNIGADIAGMGAAGNLLIPQIPGSVFSVIFTVILMYASIALSYHRIATILKYLCITLFCYLIIPFLAQTQWRQAFLSTFIPKIQWNASYFMALVAILGTTISPYLFFWQASMEVEEVHRRHLLVDKAIVSNMEQDVRIGLGLTNLVFYFIILTTGTVLFNAGIYQIDTAEQAAMALEPLAGKSAFLLFAIGILGTGALAIPVLAGSLSYMLAEVFNWQEGLNKKFHQAKGFYITLMVSMIVGLAINLTGISPFKMLFYTAVLYGIIAPVIIALILHICNNQGIMGAFTNTRKDNILGTITLVLMTLTAIVLMVLL